MEPFVSHHTLAERGFLVHFGKSWDLTFT